MRSLSLVDSMDVLDLVVFHNLVLTKPTAETNEEALAFICQLFLKLVFMKTCK